MKGLRTLADLTSVCEVMRRPLNAVPWAAGFQYLQLCGQVEAVGVVVLVLVASMVGVPLPVDDGVAVVVADVVVVTVVSMVGVVLVDVVVVVVVVAVVGMAGVVLVDVVVHSRSTQPSRRPS